MKIDQPKSNEMNPVVTAIKWAMNHPKINDMGPDEIQQLISEYIPRTKEYAKQLRDQKHSNQHKVLKDQIADLTDCEGDNETQRLLKIREQLQNKCKKTKNPQGGCE